MKEDRQTQLLWWLLPKILADMPMPFIHPERRLSLGGPPDAQIYEAARFTFRCFPILDGAAPTLQQAREFVSFVDVQRNAKRPVAVHCEAGLGRTGTMLAAYLIARGDAAEAAIASVRKIEPTAIETRQQLDFLTMYACLVHAGNG